MPDTGYEAATRLLGKDSDLVKMKGESISSMSDVKPSYDHGQYRNFRKGGAVKSKLSGLAKKEAKSGAVKEKPKKVMKTKMVQDTDMDAMKKGGKAMKKNKGGKCYEKGGSVKGSEVTQTKIIGDNTKTLTGQEGTEDQTALMKKKGGKVNKYAMGGSGKLRKGVMKKNGEPNPNAC